MATKFTPKMNREIGRQVRFFLEERYPDDWGHAERMQDAVNMLENFFDYPLIDDTDPPDEAWDAAAEMGRRYEAARAEYAEWRADFLARIGPEMDI